MTPTLEQLVEEHGLETVERAVALGEAGTLTVRRLASEANISRRKAHALALALRALVAPEPAPVAVTAEQAKRWSGCAVPLPGSPVPLSLPAPDPIPPEESPEAYERALREAIYEARARGDAEAEAKMVLTLARWQRSRHDERADTRSDLADLSRLTRDEFIVLTALHAKCRGANSDRDVLGSLGYVRRV